MIVQVAPVESHVNETLCSLNFAQRVRSVELGMAQKRQEGSDLANSKARLTQNEVCGLQHIRNLRSAGERIL